MINESMLYLFWLMWAHTEQTIFLKFLLKTLPISPVAAAPDAMRRNTSLAEVRLEDLSMCTRTNFTYILSWDWPGL